MQNVRKKRLDGHLRMTDDAGMSWEEADNPTCRDNYRQAIAYGLLAGPDTAAYKAAWVLAKRYGGDGSVPAPAEIDAELHDLGEPDKDDLSSPGEINAALVWLDFYARTSNDVLKMLADNEPGPVPVGVIHTMIDLQCEALAKACPVLTSDSERIHAVMDPLTTGDFVRYVVATRPGSVNVYRLTDKGRDHVELIERVLG